MILGANGEPFLPHGQNEVPHGALLARGSKKYAEVTIYRVLGPDPEGERENMVDLGTFKLPSEGVSLCAAIEAALQPEPEPEHRASARERVEALRAHARERVEALRARLDAALAGPAEFGTDLHVGVEDMQILLTLSEGALGAWGAQ